MELELHDGEVVSVKLGSATLSVCVGKEDGKTVLSVKAV